MEYLIIDFSTIAFKNFFSEAKDNPMYFDDEENIYKLKHSILFSLFCHIKKTKIDFKNTILAIDSKKYWRRKYFEHYKARRKLQRKATDMDFNGFYKEVNSLLDDIKKYFPIKVIYQEYCEGDDICYILSKHLSQYYKIHIYSRDKDLYQVLRFKNVSLYNPDKKKNIVISDKDLKKKINKHILMGDKGDDIPNILSDSDVFITPGKRQKPFGEKTIEKLMKNGNIVSYLEEYNENVIRNKRMIDMEYIPKKLVERVLEQWSVELTKDVKDNEMINYLRENKMPNILNLIGIDETKIRLKQMMKDKYSKRFS